MDFYYPTSIVWCGYSSEYLKYCPHRRKNECEQCRKKAKDRGIPICNAPGELEGCPLFHEYYGISQDTPSENVEPPVGEGYQLWEFTSEGSPQSPVFSSLRELCEWCEKNATVYAKTKATREQWHDILKNSILFVEARGITYSLPMDDEQLYNTDPDNSDLFSTLKTARCRYAGLLTRKLPEMVSVKEMNMLSFVIQQFDEAENMEFEQHISAISHAHPGELINLALSICPEAAGFEKGSGVTPVYSGENLHEIMRYKIFLEQIKRYPHMQIMKFYYPIDVSNSTDTFSTSELSEEELVQYQKGMSLELANFFRSQDFITEEVLYYKYLQERNGLLFEYPNVEVRDGELYGAVVTGVEHPLLPEEVKNLIDYFGEVYCEYTLKLTDMPDEQTTFCFTESAINKPTLLDMQAWTPREIFKLLSPFREEWLLNTTGFIPDFRTNIEFSETSSCWIAMSYNRRTRRVSLPATEQELAEALYQIGVSIMDEAKFYLFIPGVYALNDKRLAFVDMKRLNTMASLLLENPVSKVYELNNYLFSNDFTTEKGIEAAISFLQAAKANLDC